MDEENVLFGIDFFLTNADQHSYLLLFYQSRNLKNLIKIERKSKESVVSSALTEMCFLH